MSAGDAASRTAAIRSQSRRQSLWAIGLSALLVVAGLGRRTVEPRSGQDDLVERGDRRGRFAEGPSKIPAIGWKDILLRVYNGISENRILANAAGVTYYALLALFPGIAALVSIYGLFADPNTIVSHVDAVTGVAPGGAIDVIRQELTRLSAQGSTALGVGFIIGLVISLWSANSAIKALFDSLNVVYEETETRGFIRLNLPHFMLYDRDHRFLVDCACLHRRSSRCPQSPAASKRNQCGFGDHSVADSAGACDVWPDPDLPVWPKSRGTAMAMDHLGQCLCRYCLARRFGTVLLVLGPFWKLQQDLRFARGRHRIYDLDVAVDNRGFDRRQAQRRNRASDCTR